MHRFSEQGHCFNFLKPDEIKAHAGLSTGSHSLDHFLLWKGIPKGALSYLSGHKGLGATSLWIQTATQITQVKKHVAWIEDSHTKLNPWTLKKQNLSLSYLFWVSTPKDLRQKLWALQELISIDLFEMVGCCLGKDFLKDHQLLKLKRLAQRHQTAVVFLSERPMIHSYLSFSINFEKKQAVILRALHRPTPHPIERREMHAHTLPEFISEREHLNRRELSGI